MQFFRYCTAALLMLGAGATAAAQTPPVPQPLPGEATFTVFQKGIDVGREQVNLTRSGAEWVLSSTGRVGDVTINRFEIKYATDWQPMELRLEATQTSKDGYKRVQISTSFAMTSAINEITQNGITNSRTDQISAR